MGLSNEIGVMTIVMDESTRLGTETMIFEYSRTLLTHTPRGNDKIIVQDSGGLKLPDSN